MSKDDNAKSDGLVPVGCSSLATSGAVNPLISRGLVELARKKLLPDQPIDEALARYLQDVEAIPLLNTEEERHLALQR